MSTDYVHTEKLREIQGLIRYEITRTVPSLNYEMDGLPNLTAVTSDEEFTVYKRQLGRWFADRAEGLADEFESALDNGWLDNWDDVREEVDQWAPLRYWNEDAPMFGDEDEEDKRPDLIVRLEELPNIFQLLDELNTAMHQVFELVADAENVFSAETSTTA